MYRFNMDKKRNKNHSFFGVCFFLYFFRMYEFTNYRIIKVLCKVMMKIYKIFHCIEITAGTNIGGGLYLGHPYCITINYNAVIGNNVNIHKGVTIGQETRGKRKGVPIIGNRVWIGVNATIVGNIIIGDDVLIAPNCYVNCDIPSHSIVLGNPCIIKPCVNATAGYINDIV